MKSFLLLILTIIILIIIRGELPASHTYLIAPGVYNENYVLTKLENIVSLILTFLFVLFSSYLNLNFIRFSIELKKFKSITTILNVILPLIVTASIEIFYSVTSLFVTYFNPPKLQVVSRCLEARGIYLLYSILVYIFFIKKNVDYYNRSIRKTLS